MGPKAEKSKSQQLQEARVAKASGTSAPLAFTIEEDRPVSVGKAAEMTPLHDAIFATLEKGKGYVKVPLIEGKNAVQMQRICRYPLLKNGLIGKGKGITFRRVVSVDHLKVWLEPKKATKSKEERDKEKAERAARKAAKLKSVKTA